MRICLFNATQVGSTGSIVKTLATNYKHSGHEVLCFFGEKKEEWDDVDCFFTVKNKIRKYLNKFEARFDGRDGFVNSSNTKKVIKEIDKFKPDIIHLHNMHGEWINFALIMKYAKKKNIPVVMTVHDCWIGTGRCAHYSFNGCNRFLKGCGGCPHRLNYPKLYVLDRSKHFWRLKRRCVFDIKLLFSPSNWLSNELKKSGITNEIKVVGNPYDESVFYPKEKRDDKQQKVIGFCSFVWNESKGLSMMQRIGEYYVEKGMKVVVVGMGQNDPRLPDGAIGIAKTTDRKQLADLYRSFNVFVNTTRQDIYSMTNLEATACGTLTVVARIGGAFEPLMGTCQYGIINNYLFDNFVNTIDRMLKNGDMATSSLKHASKFFCSNMIKYYLDFIVN